MTLLTFRCRVLEKIPPFNAQEVKHPPVCGRLRDSGDPKSLSSASLPPQGLAVGHVFPNMAHQPANVDHFVGWEVQEDLLQDIHRGCEELTGHRYVKSASKHRRGIETLETTQEPIITQIWERYHCRRVMCMALKMVEIGCQACFVYCRETWLVTQRSR